MNKKEKIENKKRVIKNVGKSLLSTCGTIAYIFILFVCGGTILLLHKNAMNSVLFSDVYFFMAFGNFVIFAIFSYQYFKLFE